MLKLLTPILILLMTGGCWRTYSTTPPQSTQAVAVKQESSVPASFQAALEKAREASTLTQSAKSQDNWKKVANLWYEAIVLMKTIPVGDRSYDLAKQKTEEYEQNLEYARNKARDISLFPKERNPNEKWQFLFKSPKGYVYVDTSSIQKDNTDNTSGKQVVLWSLLQTKDAYEYSKIEVNCNGFITQPLVIEIKDKYSGKTLKKENLSGRLYYPHSTNDERVYSFACSHNS